MEVVGGEDGKRMDAVREACLLRMSGRNNDEPRGSSSASIVRHQRLRKRETGVDLKSEARERCIVEVYDTADDVSVHEHGCRMFAVQ